LYGIYLLKFFVNI